MWLQECVCNITSPDISLFVFTESVDIVKLAAVLVRVFFQSRAGFRSPHARRLSPTTFVEDFRRILLVHARALSA